MRYGNIEYIINLPFYDGILYIKKAIGKNQEKTLWELWLTVLPNMNKDNYISFEDFKTKATHKERKTDEEMLAMVKILNAAFGGKVVES